MNKELALKIVKGFNEQKESIEQLRDVVIEGAALRLRPILLTTITTIVGITPLIFASDIWRPADRCGLSCVRAEGGDRKEGQHRHQSGELHIRLALHQGDAVVPGQRRFTDQEYIRVEGPIGC